MTRTSERTRRTHPPKPDLPRREAPLFRLDRIETARERIRRRYYDREDVRRALVESLLVELSV